MIGGKGKGNFAKEHWDWLVLGGAALALAGAAAFYLFGSGVEDPDGDDVRQRVKRAESGGRMATPADIRSYAGDAFKPAKPVPPELAEVPVKGGFMASERRLWCPSNICGTVIALGLKRCPACGAELEKKKVVTVVLDGDGDGIHDEWERKNGLNPKDKADGAADADGDLFSNFEEFTAGTNPKDPKDHPDYLPFLKLNLPLKETTLPFYLKGVTPLRDGVVRMHFFDPKKKNAYGQRGTTYSVLAGEEIGKTGFVAVSYEKKTARRALKGGKGMVGEVDVSEATVERKGDKKRVRLVLDERRPVAVDVQAVLAFTRGEGREYTVVPNDRITVGEPKCGGVTCTVVKIDRLAKGAEVTLKAGPAGKEFKVKALEP